MSFRDMIFATPWWLLILLVVVAAALWWSGNNRRDRTLMRVGLGVLLVAVLLATVSYFVDTDKEAVTKKTRLLVTSVEKRDWPTFESLLDQRTSFMNMYRNKDELVAGAKKSADAIGLKSIHIWGMEVTQTDTVIRVDMKVSSEQERSGGQLTVTNWRFDWQNFGTGWKLTTITPLASQQVNPDQIMQNLERPR